MNIVELLSTGIKRLDDALGGGLLEDSITLIVYDTYSLGWGLGMKIMENRMKEGDFGVIINNSMPVTLMEMEFNGIGFDLRNYGESGDLDILDMFASFYNIDYNLPYIHTVDNVDTSTYLPKYLNLYRKLLMERIGDRRPVGVSVTFDGLAFLLGEKNLIKILQKNLAEKERARLTEERKRPVNIILLNRDRVSKEFVSWVALYSQYIIEFTSSGVGVEEMFVRKSPLPNFEPKKYELTVGKGKIEPLD
ncbi:RAD55 family ATPase [Palaeococcus sp. (in: euryarchaeotes)]